MPETPQVIHDPREMARRSEQARTSGQRVGFVPTMGALHAGHLALVEWARANCDLMVVSIFVNPLQFDRADDLRAYPRTFDEDLAKLAALDVDVVYNPTVDHMYPQGFQTTVSVSHMTQGLCGACRPGHFDGVTTVVTKLFNAVKPHLAAFGEKDYQQLQVLKRMARDLDMDIEVVGRPTVREADGLAMSSRNVHLSPEERQRALCLWRALTEARDLAAGGEADAEAIKTAARRIIESTSGARIDYVEVFDAESLENLTRLGQRPARMAMAVWLGSTRLIDNAALN